MTVCEGKKGKGKELTVTDNDYFKCCIKRL